MGCYDIVNVRCSYCGKQLSSQTKVLAGNTLTFLTIGSKIGNEKLSDCIFLLKGTCECEKKSAIVIKDRVIKQVVKEDKATVAEERWGDYVWLK